MSSAVAPILCWEPRAAEEERSTANCCPAVDSEPECFPWPGYSSHPVFVFVPTSGQTLLWKAEDTAANMEAPAHGKFALQLGKDQQ